MGITITMKYAFSGNVCDVRCVFLIECKEGACQLKLDKYVDLLLRL